MTGEAPTVEQEEANRLRRKQWRNLVMFVVTLFVFTVSGIYYANWKAERTAREGERRWCSLLGTMDSAYQEAPPSTPTGRKLAADIHELHEGFQCPETKP